MFESYYVPILRQCASLEKNWDGYNASALDIQVLANCYVLAEILKYKLEVYPTARNSIQFEYSFVTDKVNHYFELEVYNDKINVFIVYDRNYQSAINFSIPLDKMNMINTYIKDFLNVCQCHSISALANESTNVKSIDTDVKSIDKSEVNQLNMELNNEDRK